MNDLDYQFRLIRSQLVLLWISWTVLAVGLLFLGCEVAAVFFRTGPLWWWTHG